MSQAIQTKVLPATNFRPTRIVAWCQRGALTRSHDFAGPLDSEQVHRAVALALVLKFLGEDAEKYGSQAASNPWGRPFVTGCLPDGSFAHVFTSKPEPTKPAPVEYALSECVDELTAVFFALKSAGPQFAGLRGSVAQTRSKARDVLIKAKG